MRRMLASMAVAATVVSGGAAVAEEINLKFAVFTPEQEITYQQAMKPWAEEVMAASGGRVTIDLYPGGTLGRDGSKQIKMLKDGVADIAFIIPAYNPGLFPDNAVIELPDTTANAIEGSVAFWRLYEKGLLRGYEDFEVLGLFTTSPYLIHATSPINSVEDLAGKKIRIAGKLEQQCVEALGGVPVGMPVSKVAESLSRGVIDATPMHYAALHAFGVAGATDHHYHNMLGSIPFGFVMTREKFDALPEDVQIAMREKGGEALARIFGAAMDAENERLLAATLADSSQTVVEPDAADRAKWAAAVASCVEQWVAEHDKGAELHQALLAEIDAIRAE